MQHPGESIIGADGPPMHQGGGLGILPGQEIGPAVRWNQGSEVLDNPYARAFGAEDEPLAVNVYRSVNAANEVQYVGITNNLARRAAEHLRASGIQVEKLMGRLSRSDARAVEQALIDTHGLRVNGGTLLNRINSIAETNKKYADQLRRGYELLQSVGY
jgi:hypothetical protein